MSSKELLLIDTLKTRIKKRSVINKDAIHIIPTGINIKNNCISETLELLMPKGSVKARNNHIKTPDPNANCFDLFWTWYAQRKGS